MGCQKSLGSHAVEVMRAMRVRQVQGWIYPPAQHGAAWEKNGLYNNSNVGISQSRNHITTQHPQPFFFSGACSGSNACTGNCASIGDCILLGAFWMRGIVE